MSSIFDDPLAKRLMAWDTKTAYVFPDWLRVPMKVTKDGKEWTVIAKYISNDGRGPLGYLVLARYANGVVENQSAPIWAVNH